MQVTHSPTSLSITPSGYCSNSRRGGGASSYHLAKGEPACCKALSLVIFKSCVAALKLKWAVMSVCLSVCLAAGATTRMEMIWLLMWDPSQKPWRSVLLLLLCIILIFYQYATGIPAVVIGKPSPSFFQSALHDLQTAPENVSGSIIILPSLCALHWKHSFWGCDDRRWLG